MQNAVSFSNEKPKDIQLIQVQETVIQQQPQMQQQYQQPMNYGYQQPMNYGYQQPQIAPPDDFVIDMPKLNLVIQDGTSTSTVDVAPSKRSRSKKPSTSTLDNGTTIITAYDNSNQSKNSLSDPYLDTYGESTNALKIAIVQMDALAGDINNDLQEIRASKTLKGKYQYIPTLAGAMTQILSTKVTALREINKTITDCHNLELKRYKDLKVDQANVDQDKLIMDTYNAFIGMPMGGTNGFIPNPVDMTMMNGPASMVRADAGTMDYNAYAANMSPAQRAMRYEHNPDVKTVVMFDAVSGAKYFDIINIKTGESIPGLQRPDQMFLEDTYIDTKINKARNSNLNEMWDLVVLNANQEFNKY